MIYIGMFRALRALWITVVFVLGCMPQCGRKDRHVPYVAPPPLPEAPSVSSNSPPNPTHAAVFNWPSPMPAVTLEGLILSAPQDEPGAGWRACVNVDVNADQKNDALCWLERKTDLWELRLAQRTANAGKDDNFAPSAVLSSTPSQVEGTCTITQGSFDVFGQYQVAKAKGQCGPKQWQVLDVLTAGKVIDRVVIDKRRETYLGCETVFVGTQTTLSLNHQCGAKGAVQTMVSWSPNNTSRSLEPLQAAFASVQANQAVDVTQNGIVLASRALCAETGQPYVGFGNGTSVSCQLKSAYQDLLISSLTSLARRKQWAQLSLVWDWLSEIKATTRMDGLPKILNDWARKQKELWSVHGTVNVRVPAGWSPQPDAPSLLAFVEGHKLLVRSDAPQLFQCALGADGQIVATPLEPTLTGEAGALPLAQAWQARRSFSSSTGPAPSPAQVHAAFGFQQPPPMRWVALTSTMAFAQWNNTLWRIDLANPAASPIAQRETIVGSMLGPLMSDGQRIVRALPFGVSVFRFAPSPQFELIVPVDWGAMPAKAADAALSQDGDMLAVLSGTSVFLFSRQGVYQGP